MSVWGHRARAHRGDTGMRGWRKVRTKEAAAAWKGRNKPEPWMKPWPLWRLTHKLQLSLSQSWGMINSSPPHMPELKCPYEVCRNCLQSSACGTVEIVSWIPHEHSRKRLDKWLYCVCITSLLHPASLMHVPKGPAPDRQSLIEAVLQCLSSLRAQNLFANIQSTEKRLMRKQGNIQERIQPKPWSVMGVQLLIRHLSGIPSFTWCQI